MASNVLTIASIFWEWTVRSCVFKLLIIWNEYWANVLLNFPQLLDVLNARRLVQQLKYILLNITSKIRVLWIITNNTVNFIIINLCSVIAYYYVKECLITIMIIWYSSVKCHTYCFVPYDFSSRRNAAWDCFLGAFLCIIKPILRRPASRNSTGWICWWHSVSDTRDSDGGDTQHHSPGSWWIACRFESHSDRCTAGRKLQWKLCLFKP